MRKLLVIAVAASLAACSGTNASGSSSGSTGAVTASGTSGSTAASTTGAATTSSSGTSASATSTSGSSTGTSTTGSSGSSGAATTSSSGSGGTGGFESAHNRCLDEATAACQHDENCGSLNPADESLCVATYNCDDTVAESVADEQVDAGLATVDASALSACIQDIGNAACGDTGSAAIHGSLNCATVSRGLGGQGDACTTGNDCQVHFSCVRASTACGGTCQPWATSGPCGLGNGAVAVGFFCGDDGGVNPQSDAGAACLEDKECLPPYVCEGAAGAKTCATQGTGAQGDPCAGTHECALGFTCLNGGSDAGFCWPRSGDTGLCNLVFSDGGLSLRADGGARPVESLCLDQLYCDQTHATCHKQAVLGDACTPDAGNPHCLEGACVDNGSGSTCSYAPDGTACTRAADCSSGVCFPIADGGAVCGDTCP
ncbi:MAG: hypothetical protein JST54_07730 [Deltaproteobacteria bacterium]|nr:hypothetical protein [Deltaproteobacteria bacterium]